MITFKQLREWRNTKATTEIAQGVTEFVGTPENWLKDPHFFCINGHVSATIGEHDNVCLKCHQPVLLGPLIDEAEFAKELTRIPINLFTEIVRKAGRDYITPEDVTIALHIRPYYGGSLDTHLTKVRLDLLEVLGEWGAKDIGLCAVVAWKGV